MQNRLVWGIALIALSASISSCTPRGESITVRDRYKLFYQDHFGAAHHANMDSVVALQGIRYELGAMETDSSGMALHSASEGLFFFENPHADYVRVNLQAVRDSLITAEELAGFFARTVEADDHPLWRRFGHTVHHSDEFKNTYHPHYRVIKRTLIPLN